MKKKIEGYINTKSTTLAAIIKAKLDMNIEIVIDEEIQSVTYMIPETTATKDLVNRYRKHSVDRTEFYIGVHGYNKAFAELKTRTIKFKAEVRRYVAEDKCLEEERVRQLYVLVTSGQPQPISFGEFKKVYLKDEPYRVVC